MRRCRCGQSYTATSELIGIVHTGTSDDYLFTRFEHLARVTSFVRRSNPPIAYCDCIWPIILSLVWLKARVGSGAQPPPAASSAPSS